MILHLFSNINNCLKKRLAISFLRKLLLSFLVFLIARVPIVPWISDWVNSWSNHSFNSVAHSLFRANTIFSFCYVTRELRPQRCSNSSLNYNRSEMIIQIIKFDAAQEKIRNVEQTEFLIMQCLRKKIK